MNVIERRGESSLTQEAADWHARLRSNSVSEVEQVRFRAWLSGDPARRREFDALSALWDKLDAVAQSPEIMDQRRQIAGQADAAAPVSRRAIIGWALAAGVTGAAGFMTWQRMFASSTFGTGVGEQRIVPLADGSVVTLNTSSRIRVRFSGNERRIHVEQGQVHFEVARDRTKPFIVSAGQGEVLALGTAFDVYQRAQDIVVTLIEGRVAVVPYVPAGKSGVALALVSSATASGELKQNGLQAFVLNAGEQVSYGTPGQPPQHTSADLQHIAAWRARKLVFMDTPLTEAISDANRYSQLKIELRAPGFADAKISGTFDAGRNEALAEGLQAYFGLRAERSGNDLIRLTPQAR